MEKKYIETFIKKYHLGGALEGVLWQNDNGNLVATAMTSERKLFVNTVWKNGAFFSDVDVAIQDTGKLKHMLTPFGDNVTITVNVDENDKSRARYLFIEDGKTEAVYVTAQKSVLDPVPKMKNMPQFGVELILTPDFISIFNDSLSAINDKDTLFTVVMSKKKQKLETVLGYKQNLNDCIIMSTTVVAGKDTVKNPISFSAKHLKEVLSANSEVESPVLLVSEDGIAHISFDKDDFVSGYYFIKIDVED